MPTRTRVQLDLAIERELLEHEWRCYDLLRTDPRFVPWIGYDRGAAGKRRLDRYIEAIRESQPEKFGHTRRGNRRGRVEAKPVDDAWAPLSARVEAVHAEVTTVTPTPRDRGEIDVLQHRKQTLQRALARATNEFGEPRDLKSYLQISRELEQTEDKIEARETRGFMDSGEFRKGLIDLMIGLIPKEGRQAAKAAMNQYIATWAPLADAPA